MKGKGCKAWLNTEGGIALLIAKHYLQLSDSMLIERLNTDWALQLFCGIRLNNQRIHDEDLPGRWRRYLGKYLDIDKWQVRLAAYWRVEMQNTHVGMTDATCYESYINYPTDAKLLWKCCAEVFGMISQMRKALKLRRSRANHNGQKNKYLSFAKMKKKSRRKSKKICKSLLKYLDRLLKQLGQLREAPSKPSLSNRQYNRLKVIEKVKQQQWQLHFGKDSKVPDRIVSLHKPY